MTEAMNDLARLEPLVGRQFAISGVSLTPAPAADRLVIRATEEVRDQIGEALGAALPGNPKGSSMKGGITVLWLGPDEWLVLAEAGSDPAARLADIDPTQFASVDVSHRNTAIIAEGALSQVAISAGCPQDLSLMAFPPGACSRTVLGKAEIVLYREAAGQFRVECWRSFSDYVWRFLVDAAKSA